MGSRLVRYSLLSLIRQALSGNAGWPEQWRSPEPKPAYDAAIVGGGGHGLATAYYMAKEYDLRNIAVVEKGWLGGGNTGRNTTGPIVLIAGNTFRHSIPGGGGYGNPLERDPALILEDVLDGKVSAYQALSHYGVVIKAIGVTGTNFIVDELATAKARQASIT